VIPRSASRPASGSPLQPTEEQPTLEELLRQADIAMYKAKADRSGFAHFAASNDDGTPNRLTLLGELRQGLDCEEFVVYYQPKIAVDTGELVGVEALVRWQHPTRGLLLPGEFIALAEESTLIHRLTTVVIDMALRCCRTWLDQGLRLPVAVNVSARSLCDPQFPAMVSDRIASAGAPASLLTIELTEGTALAQSRRGTGDPAEVAGHGGSLIGGRLRHRLLHHGLSEEPSRDRVEDRPGIHQRREQRSP